jgi:hypothetical protein
MFIQLRLGVGLYICSCMCICLYVLFIICRMATTELFLQMYLCILYAVHVFVSVKPCATVSFLTATKTQQAGSENSENQVYVTGYSLIQGWTSSQYALTNSMELGSFGQVSTYSATQEQHNFKKPEGSLPCSQEPATGSCPEPDESSPYSPILFFRINFNIVTC